MLTLSGELPLGVPVEDIVRDARAVISHIYDDAAQMSLAQRDVDSGVPVRNVTGDVTEQFLHDDPRPARGRLQVPLLAHNIVHDVDEHKNIEVRTSVEIGVQGAGDQVAVAQGSVDHVGIRQ